MTETREERIRERAHEIWEREGNPSGQEEAHWEQAAREIDAEETIANVSSDVEGEPRGLGDEEAVADVQSGGIGELGKAAAKPKKTAPTKGRGRR